MPKMVCVKCEVEFRPETNGVHIFEMMNNNTKIYKIWQADKWRCPECGVEVVAGFAQHPTREQFDDDIEFVSKKMLDDGNVIYDKERFGE